MRPKRITQRTMAFVLAGGRGSRLKELTNLRVKPAVPFGGRGRLSPCQEFIAIRC